MMDRSRTHAGMAIAKRRNQLECSRELLAMFLSLTVEQIAQVEYAKSFAEYDAVRKEIEDGLTILEIRPSLLLGFRSIVAARERRAKEDAQHFLVECGNYDDWCDAGCAEDCKYSEEFKILEDALARFRTLGSYSWRRLVYFNGTCGIDISSIVDEKPMYVKDKITGLFNRA